MTAIVLELWNTLFSDKHIVSLPRASTWCIIFKFETGALDLVLAMVWHQAHVLPKFGSPHLAIDSLNWERNTYVLHTIHAHAFRTLGAVRDPRTWWAETIPIISEFQNESARHLSSTATTFYLFIGPRRPIQQLNNSFGAPNFWCGIKAPHITQTTVSSQSWTLNHIISSLSLWVPETSEYMLPSRQTPRSITSTMSTQPAPQLVSEMMISIHTLRPMVSPAQVSITLCDYCGLANHKVRLCYESLE